MKWLAYLSTFVLNRMCSIINSGMTTEKGFKEVHLNGVTKKIFEYYQQEVSSMQVYNHLRKWRSMRIYISKLRDLSGTGWDEEMHILLLDNNQYIGHVSVLASHLHANSIVYYFACTTITCFLNQLIFPCIRLTQRTSSSSTSQLTTTPRCSTSLPSA
jgi:hypothetical protein